jgi:hypothetical protein
VTSKKAALILTIAVLFAAFSLSKREHLEEYGAAQESVEGNPASSTPPIVEKLPIEPKKAIFSESKFDGARDCLPPGSKRDSLSAVVKELRALHRFSSATLVEENYELMGANQLKWVVQNIPSESEPIRVFKISPKDGLPDRVRDFPGRDGTLKERLEGALTLGELVSTRVTKVQSTEEADELEVESEGEEVLSLKYRSRRVQLECNSTKCFCRP